MGKISKWSGRMAVDELAKRGKHLAVGKRSRDELYSVLTLTIRVVRLWERKLSPGKHEQIEGELLGLLEYRSGVKGGMEHYLLRAAFGHDPSRRKIVTAWAQACVNLASHMRKTKLPFTTENVRRMVEEFGVQRARLNDFGKTHLKQHRGQQAREEEDW